MSDFIGCCPKCDSDELEYGGFVNLEVSYYPFTCQDCGAKGKEYYTVDFLRMGLNEDEVEDDINVGWSKDIPEENGKFWFYGQLFRAMDKVKLEIVHVHKISNGFMYHTTGFIDPKEARGVWRKIDEPELPDLDNSEN